MGSKIVIANDIFSVLRAKIRIHFYFNQFHNQKNLSELIKIVDEIESYFKSGSEKNK